jgi:hypothetical protein
MKVTNVSTGPRGLFGKDGALVMLEVGQSAEGDFDADQPAEWFEVAAVKVEKPAAKPATKAKDAE